MKEALHLYRHVILHVKDAPNTAARMDALLIRCYSKQRIKIWQEIQEQIQDAPLPLLYLGKAHEAIGDHDAALIAYKRALEINPSLDDAQNGITRMEAESCYRR